MKKIKLGLVGSGYIAKFHYEAFKFIGYSPSFLVSSNFSKTAKSFAAKYSISKVIKEDDFLLQKKTTLMDLLLLVLQIKQKNISNGVLRIRFGL